MITRQRDRELVWDVKLHCHSDFPPVSDNKVMSNPVRLLGRFANNRQMRTAVILRTDLQCLTTDLGIGREVDAAVAKHLQENPLTVLM